MNKRNIKIALALILVLSFSFFLGEFRSNSNKADLVKDETLVKEDSLEKKNIEKKEKTLEKEEEAKEEEPEEDIEKNEVKDIELELKDKDIEKKEARKEAIKKPEKVKSEEKKEAPKTQKTVSIRVSAKTLLNNKDKLDKNKHGLVPANGIIYFNKSAKLEDGDSVFDVLSRELRGAGIHLESSMTPVYKTNYVEGINNIYEFDAGELSGWMYRVNGSFPSYGSSEVRLKDGDVIDWLYTCDLGKDIGGRNELGGGR